MCIPGHFPFPDCNLVNSGLLLVTTGYNDGGRLKTTEVVDLDSQDLPVPTFQNYSKSLDGAVGGWVRKLFIVCGGYVDGEDFSKECYKIGIESISLHGNMKEKRGFAASIELADKLWVLGGQDGSKTLASTEYIHHNGSQEDGPDLPIDLYGHAAIKINETHSMIIGGHGIGKTWFYSHLIGQWIDGPNLLKARQYHSVGLITRMEDTSIVVTGGFNSGTGELDSVEILDIDGTAWTSGELL